MDQGDGARAKRPEVEAALAEFEEGLAEVQRTVRRKQAPNRYQARALLMALGWIVLDQGEEQGPAASLVQRLEEAVAPQREAWERAVREELTLACAEHVLGVDPRYLEHPRFDFEYVVAARERLEARLAAAGALDLMLPEERLDELSAADRRLEPYLERQAGAGPAGG